MPAMPEETLEDHLRRATRNFTARLAEDVALTLGRDLALELQRGHQGTPPRFPEVDPARIAMADGKPRLEGGPAAGEAREALFQLGALVQQLVTGERPQVSWRLDGPPRAPLSTLSRTALLASLTAAAPEARFASAEAAAAAIDTELLAKPGSDPVAWPLFRGDAGRTGAAPALAGPGNSLVAVWSVAVGSVVASPLLTARLVLVPTQDGRLVVLERGTGRLIAALKVASAIESSPALQDDRLLLGTDDGDLVALDLATARPLWTAKVGSMVRSSPLPFGERIVVGVVETKETGGIVALDKAGKVLWRQKRGAVFSSPASDGERILAAGDDGELVALDPAKGKPLWKHTVGGRIRATPAVAGGVAVVGDFEGRLVAVRLADGSRVWTRELGQPVYSSAAWSGDLVVVGCHDGLLRGFAASDGTPRFETPTRGPVVASPTAAGGGTIVGSTDGDLYLLGPEGQVLTRTRLAEGGTQSSAACDAAGLVVGSARGVHAFRLAS
jgi:outer membrane protein assembly factor BamB